MTLLEFLIKCVGVAHGKYSQLLLARAGQRQVTYYDYLGINEPTNSLTESGRNIEKEVETKRVELIEQISEKSTEIKGIRHIKNGDHWENAEVFIGQINGIAEVLKNKKQREQYNKLLKAERDNYSHLTSLIADYQDTFKIHGIGLTIKPRSKLLGLEDAFSKRDVLIAYKKISLILDRIPTETEDKATVLVSVRNAKAQAFYLAQALISEVTDGNELFVDSIIECIAVNQYSFDILKAEPYVVDYAKEINPILTELANNLDNLIFKPGDRNIVREATQKYIQCYAEYRRDIDSCVSANQDNNAKYKACQPHVKKLKLASAEYLKTVKNKVMAEGSAKHQIMSACIKVAGTFLSIVGSVVLGIVLGAGTGAAFGATIGLPFGIVGAGPGAAVCGIVGAGAGLLASPFIAYKMNLGNKFFERAYLNRTEDGQKVKPHLEKLQSEVAALDQTLYEKVPPAPKSWISSCFGG